MSFKLGTAPKEITVHLAYPYLSGAEQPRHHFPRLSKKELRQISEDIFGKDLNRREVTEEAQFRWWKANVLEKTHESYEGLGENWKDDLWADPDGHDHVLDAVEGYFQAVVPRSFLAR